MPISKHGPDRRAIASSWRTNRACVSAVGLAAVSVLVGWLSAVAGLGESLWLDELHTAWVAAGPLEEVMPRASLGNQLPLYFGWQWLVVQTVGMSEVSLRATSLVAWAGLLMSLALFLFHQARRTGGWHLLAMVALVAVDRNQQFFATEARPYAMLSLLTLWSWFLLSKAALFQAKQAAPSRRGGVTGRNAGTSQFVSGIDAGRDAPGGGLSTLGWRGWSGGYRRVAIWGAGSWGGWEWAMWWLCSGGAFWLQPTALLAWSAQLLILTGWALSAWSMARFAGLALAVGGLAIIAVPAWWLVGDSWQARQAWAAFAADASLQNLLRQLPIVAMVGPVLAAAGLRKLWQTLGTQPSPAPHGDPGTQHGASGTQHHGQTQLSAGTQVTSRHPEGTAPALGTQLAIDPERNTGTQHVSEGPRREFCWAEWGGGGEWAIWLIAWAAPLALVAVLAATQIAPLVHPRYLFAASAPLIVWAALAIRHWEPFWGWITVLVMFVCLVGQQGSLDQWRAGRWTGPVRGEDWRAVGQTIAVQAIASRQWRPLVFCVSNLIEGNATGRVPLDRDSPVVAPLPANPVTVEEPQRWRAYLALPLQSLYHPDNFHRDHLLAESLVAERLRPGETRPGAGVDLRAQIVPLWNDPQSWPWAIAEARDRSAAQRQAEWWLAVRCSAGGLERRLKSSGLRPQKCYDFGGVQLLQFHE